MPNKKNGKSSMDYYRENPESYAKRKAAQKKMNATPEERKRRSELVKKNREAQKKGTGRVGDGKDFDHATNRMVNQSKNRGRTGKNGTPGTSGDKRARGGKR